MPVWEAVREVDSPNCNSVIKLQGTGLAQSVLIRSDTVKGAGQMKHPQFDRALHVV